MSSPFFTLDLCYHMLDSQEECDPHLPGTSASWVPFHTVARVGKGPMAFLLTAPTTEEAFNKCADTIVEDLANNNNEKMRRLVQDLLRQATQHVEQFHGKPE